MAASGNRGRDRDRRRPSPAARAAGALARLPDLIPGRARRRGVAGWDAEPDFAGPRLLRALAEAYPEVTFIEIGSNDGERLDPLRPFILARRWTGIMVEPVPYVFARLQENYRGLDRIKLENVVIADRDGHVPFYYLAAPEHELAEELPDWYDAVGSLSRETVLAQRDAIPDLERRIERAELPCLTFESLCRRHGLGELDLLLIDVEGHDYELIKSIDFDARQPRVLIYEHFHLSAADRAGCRAHLERRGYETMEEVLDTWCLDTRTDDSLTRCWRGLSPAAPGLYRGEWP